MKEAYNKHDTKLILVIAIALVIYLASVAAELTWSVFTPAEDTNINRPQQTNGPNVGATQQKTNLRPLLNLNLFGDASAKPAAEQAPTQVTEAEETKLPLTLSGVVASSNSKLGAAVIANRNVQDTYGIGDKIEGTNVTLDEIFADRVIIKNRGNRETLMLEGVDFDEANKRLARQREQTSSNTSPTASERPTTVSPQVREQLRSEPASFSNFFRIAPAQREGQLIGYRISPGQDPSLFNASGLENGDIITELNGRDLSNPEQALEAVSLLQEETELDLTIIRNGDYLSISIEIPSE